jgi:glycosyltransferase involved in cell wall biosynthesis
VLRRAADAFQPDIVFAFAGRAASFVPRGNYTVIGRLGGYYNLSNFQTCDYLVCNAPDLVRYVVAGGWPETRVFLIPNFPSVPDAPALDRAAFGTPRDAPLAVALGRLHPNKGLDILVRAVALVPDLFVWIAGEGPERQALETLARDLGVSGRIKFLGWRTDRAALYKAADVCVYPSREEPFGNVVVEAWSCGVPIVTTASTGPAWLARNGEDAIVTPIDDVPALAEAIRKVIASKPLASRLVAGGRRRVAEEFSESSIVRRYRDLFEQVRR